MVLVVRWGNSASANIHPRPGGFMSVILILTAVAVISLLTAIHFAGKENFVATVFMLATVALLFAALLEWQNSRVEKDSVKRAKERLEATSH